MRSLLKSVVVSILIWEAKLVLKKHTPKIVAITGSAGKTTTKDAIFAAISPGRFVRKSQKSMNSEIGVPLTILGLENAWGSLFGWVTNIVRGLWLVLSPEKYPDWLVLEVGADRPGDIRMIAKWLRPDIAVITSIPDIPVHVEYFNSPQSLAREKKYLAEYLKPEGKLIINGDDVHTKAILAEFKDVALSYGFGGQNDLDADEEAVLYEESSPAEPTKRRAAFMPPVGMRFVAKRGDLYAKEIKIYGALGKPRIYSALAALAVTEVIEGDIDAAISALGTWQPPPGRMRILPGIKGSVIIDDTYNSSPVAAISALETLKLIKSAKRRIAVLGDMMELGRFSKEAHSHVGEKAAKCAHQLVTVGLRAKAIAATALEKGMKEECIRQYELGESERAGKELEAELKEGVVVLIKGSQSMRMEKTVLEIMNDPLNAPELLVRQEAEWLER